MRMFIVLVVLLASACAVWWVTRAHLADTERTLAVYRQDIDTLQKQMAKTEQALNAIEGLRNEIAQAKQENELRFLEAANLCGNDRIAYLERMLKEDACRRTANSSAPASGESDGALQ